MKPAMTPQQKLLTGSHRKPWTVYRRLVAGEASLGSFLSFEIITLLVSNMPTALGVGLRALVYPNMFKSCGKRPLFGRGVCIRIPKSISLGDRVVFDDYSMLDVRDAGTISIGNYVTVGRFSTVTAKGGPVVFEDGVNIGSFCRVGSQTSLEIGESSLIAAYCYIGPGNHRYGDSRTPLIEKEMELKGGVKIGKRCWVGARVTILDGVTVGDDSIIGAHSLVMEDVPAKTIVVGAPAKILRKID